MRFYFPNAKRFNKAAMRLTGLLHGVTLSNVQAALSIGLGYRDLHDFQNHHRDDSPTALDDTLTDMEFRGRHTALCRSLSNILKYPDGDVQYALSVSRLTGDREFSIVDYEAVRCACWRAGPLPWKGARNAGAVVFANGNGQRSRAYLRSDRRRGVGLLCIMDASINSGRADFEVSSPRIRVEDFVPLRLYLPYGYWVTGMGSKVFFSRDYKPLWEISPNGAVKRSDPWTRVRGISSQHFFGEENADVTWHRNLTIGAATQLLKAFGIRGLPILVDILPVLVSDNELSLDEALGRLREVRAQRLGA